MEPTHSPATAPSKLARKWILRGCVSLAALYLLLLIPAPPIPAPQGAGKTPFVWNQPQFWAELQAHFEAGRQNGCDSLSESIASRISLAQRQLDGINSTRLGPDAPVFRAVETNLFHLASELAACPREVPRFVELYRRLRLLVKNQSRRWDVNTAATRDCLYRLLYGGRVALEEVLLQSPTNSVPAVLAGHDEPSRTPFASVLGVRVHSGDILVSRGTAATSALISRGNDYPGNFSHVALVYIDPQTREVSLVEAHIEAGVAVTPLDRYLQDRKYRLLFLRLRSDLPQLIKDPELPHHAAANAAARAEREHIPYDFSMDHNDPSRLFCSEVASSAYKDLGVQLWSSRSFLSAKGVTSWLASFGVREFETQEPTDLEYDPQLRVIAEWRDPAALFTEHLDNTTVDVMLERANNGKGLDYSLPMLPCARLLKAYSTILNFFGRTGPIPEGMSATAALRNQRFTQNHATLKDQLAELAKEYHRKNGFIPPHAALLELARGIPDH